MLRNIPPAHAYVDLGDPWLRHHMARLDQRHEQYGRRFLVDVGVLLARAAQVARASQSTPSVSRPRAHAGGTCPQGAGDVARVPAMVA